MSYAPARKLYAEHMTMSLSQRLADARMARPDWQSPYDALVARLHTLGVGETAPKVGERFPDFALPDSHGRYLSLGVLLEDGPIVLSFNRGGWCPYCRHELETWSSALGDLYQVGGRFVAITGEVGGRAKALGSIFKGDAVLLCDVDHAVALSAGLAFFMGASIIERYRTIGLNIGELYGTDSGFLPVPATFVIDRHQIVRYAFVDVDFRVRAEPGDVIPQIQASVG